MAHCRHHVIITGHSLGSSLSEPFTLDLVLSAPMLHSKTCNFACPRVGNKEWAGFYDSLTKSVGNPTLRVVNAEDLVPKVPPELPGYAHVGEAYEICFKSDGFRLLPDYALRHSSTNYARTLAHDFGTSVDCQLGGNTRDDLKFC